MAPSPRTHRQEAWTPGQSSEPSASDPPQLPTTTAAGSRHRSSQAIPAWGSLCPESTGEGNREAWEERAAPEPPWQRLVPAQHPPLRPGLWGACSSWGPGTAIPGQQTSSAAARGSLHDPGRAGPASLCRPGSSLCRKSLDQVARGSPWIPNCKVPGLKEDRESPPIPGPAGSRPSDSPLHWPGGVGARGQLQGTALGSGAGREEPRAAWPLLDPDPIGDRHLATNHPRSGPP